MLRILLCAALLVVAPSGAASAAKDCGYRLDGSGNPTYTCVEVDDGKPGRGDGPSRPAPCDLSGLPTFCMGKTPCWYTDWSQMWVEPPGRKPSPDAVPKIRHCLVPGELQEPVWYSGPPPEPPLEVQAVEAIGALPLPNGRLVMSPGPRGNVGATSVFKVEGMSSRVLRGSSAFGLVAYATPKTLTINPGDGSGPLRCAWAQAVSSGCEHLFTRSSVLGSARVDGQPAFTATAQAVWSLTFEDGGVPVSIPDADSEVSSDSMTMSVPVFSLQALVS